MAFPASWAEKVLLMGETEILVHADEIISIKLPTVCNSISICISAQNPSVLIQRARERSGA